MNIQFRTRTKSTIDYTPELKSLGVCCDIQGNKTQKTFLECFESGGNFHYGQTIESVNCPTVGSTGCCCSCMKDNLADLELYGDPPNYECGRPISLLTKGLTDNVTQCECTRIGGKWNPGPCPSNTVMSESEAFYYCMKQYEAGTINENTTCDFDARVPRACCFIYTDNLNVPIGVTCQNVCTEQDCELLSTSSYSSVYSPGKICNGNLTPNNTRAYCADSSIAYLMTTQKQNNSNEPFGSCFKTIHEETGYTFEVSFTTKNKCLDGYWVQIQGDFKIADHEYKPTLPVKSGIRLIEPEYMTSTEFDSLNLSIGDFYKGGLYIGTYSLGSPVSTDSSNLYIKRSEKISRKTIVKSSSYGNGSKENKKWVLLVEPELYTTEFADENEILNVGSQQTSLYDGFYNSYGNNESFYGIKTNLFNSIVGRNRKGFLDFYIPSIYELQFFTNQYFAYSSLRNNIYASSLPCMSSSLRTNTLLYSQYLDFKDLNNYGAEVISSIKQRLAMLLFRRIILT